MFVGIWWALCFLVRFVLVRRFLGIFGELDICLRGSGGREFGEDFWRI